MGFCSWVKHRSLSRRGQNAVLRGLSGFQGRRRKFWCQSVPHGEWQQVVQIQVGRWRERELNCHVSEVVGPPPRSSKGTTSATGRVECVEVGRVELEEPFQVDVEEFFVCLRKARRGAAAE